VLEHSIFIQGQHIDLCASDLRPKIIDGWFRWFNNTNVTKYLGRGVFPNTYEEQKKFVEDSIRNKDRIITLILPKGAKEYVGVASLSHIDFRVGECHFALVIGDPKNAPMLASLEAKALLTEHAFEVMGMNRIYSGQNIELKKWQRMQILLGYQIEGIARESFHKGMHVSDSYISSCLLKDYLRLKELRCGKFWPGREKMLTLIRSLPKESHLDQTEKFMRDIWNRVWEEVSLT
jgi:RimJ/RimL family protein N-acetyltransferase